MSPGILGLFKHCWQHPFSSLTSKVESKETEDNILEERNEIGDLFWPVISLLKFVGNCPLSYVYEEDVIYGDTLSHTSASSRRSNYRVYKMQYLSPYTLFCFAHGSLIMGLWATQLYETIFDVKILNIRIFNPQEMMTNYMGRDSLDVRHKYMEQTIKLMFCFIPGIQSVEIILSWMESNNFANFLNNFREFLSEYFSTFPFAQGLLRQNITHLRNKFLLFYAIVPTLLGLALVLYTNLQEDSITGVLACFLMSHITFVSSLEDVKIKLSIIRSIKWETLTASKVKSWRNVIHNIRMQAKLAGDWQKLHQLTLMIGFIVLITQAAFVLLSGSPSSPNYGLFLSVSISYILMMVGRIYLKIYAANQICQEEFKIARELVYADIPENEFALQLEVKFLHDMIQQKPCLIKFGSFATLNKKLILGIASQIVSYLIVLMQFYQSENNDKTL
ncbi:unnamed protein product [Allacma fusca]|uniref:Gustatory receptor n=1 Tax=Allacma fusca TaxID=39272 RepID=A0A8J2L476_9HEXA|nr:unnamed protein product [Allacma fusca]